MKKVVALNMLRSAWFRINETADNSEDTLWTLWILQACIRELSKEVSESEFEAGVLSTEVKG